MDACRIISRAGQIRGFGDESPPAESRGGAPVAIWGLGVGGQADKKLRK